MDALVAWGSLDAIGERVAQRVAAGADHVCLQVLTAERLAVPREEWGALASLIHTRES